MGRNAALAFALIDLCGVAARTTFVVLAIAASACAKPRPVVFGEQMPAYCQGGDLSVESCAGWLVDRILMLTDKTPFSDEKISAYISEVGNRLVRAHGDRRAWRFLVVDNEEVQAFAGLSTTVFVHRGAIALLRDEAELAAVMGHEIAHVLGGHLRENFQELMRGDAGRSADAENHADRYARDDEIQADEVAVVLLAKAGYDPRGVERMLRAYATTSPSDGADSSEHHPTWAERIARVQAIAAAYPGGETHEKRFRTRIADLVLGEDPRIAAVVGRAAVFVHANVAVDLPPHEEVDASGGSISIKLSGDTAVDLRTISPAIARELGRKPDPTVTFEIIEGKRLSLMITVMGPDMHAVARRIKASVRVPRPDEVRAVRPKRIDLDAPRVLWQP